MFFFLLTVLGYILIFIILVGIFSIVTNHILKSEGYSGPVSDHFDGKVFNNIGSKNGEQQFPDVIPDVQIDSGPQPENMISWMFRRSKNIWMNEEVKTTVPKERVEGSELVVTFINHATVLIQTGGLNILTDPHWSERASPVSFLGPKRYALPGVIFDDLPKIDVVLLSHNHYDHMDIPTLRRLQKKFSPKIYAHLGNKEYLTKRGMSNIVEMDWWNGEKISSDLTLTSVPAQHFSARAISDRNNSLWGGFVIGSSSGDIYFAGDTGFGPWAEQVAAKYPQGFRLAILPIGAFKPRSFMKEVHVAPQESLLLKEILKAKKVLAIHFGTFKLADDRQGEPREIINESVSGKNGSFLVLPNGGTADIN